MKKVLGALLILVIVLGIIGNCAGGSSNSSKTSTDAIVAAENFVKDNLKAPSTAKFSNEEAKQDNAGNWTVSGLVDSQNSFGAMLRSSFILRLDKNDSLISNVDLQQQ
jgi:hypothetical protein